MTEIFSYSHEGDKKAMMKHKMNKTLQSTLNPRNACCCCVYLISLNDLKNALQGFLLTVFSSFFLTSHTNSDVLNSDIIKHLLLTWEQKVRRLRNESEPGCVTADPNASRLLWFMRLSIKPLEVRISFLFFIAEIFRAIFIRRISKRRVILVQFEDFLCRKEPMNFSHTTAKDFNILFCGNINPCFVIFNV